jgi:hypothetical protein
MDEHDRRQPSTKRLHLDSPGGQRRGIEGFSPAPGDLYVSPLTSFLGIEWAVLRFDSSGETLYAIPADLDTRCGSRDLEIPVDATAGPLTLRCGQGLWLARTVFAPDLHSGHLEETYSRLALNRVTAIEENALQVTYPEIKAETLPSYRRWIRQGPLMARDIMAQHGAASAQRLPPAAKSQYAPLRVAAMFTLPLLLGILSTLLWSGGMAGPWDGKPGNWSSTAHRAGETSVPDEIVGIPNNLVDDYRSTTRGVSAPPDGTQKIRGQGGFYDLTLWDPDLEPAKSYHLKIVNRDSGRVHLSREVSLAPEDEEHSTIHILFRMAAYPPGHYNLLLTESSEGEIILDQQLEFAPETDPEGVP